MKKPKIFLLFMGLLGLIFLSACTTNIEDALKQIPAIDAFLKEHPDAEMRITLWDRSYVESNIESIRDKCGPQMVVREYYYVLIEEDSQKIEAFLEPETGKAVCLLRKSEQDKKPIELPPKEWEFPDVTCAKLEGNERVRCYNEAIERLCNRFEGDKRSACFQGWEDNCDRLSGNDITECYNKKQKEKDKEWAKERKVCERSGGYWNECPMDCDEGQICAAVCGKPRCEEKAPCSVLNEDACDARKDCKSEYRIYEESCQITEDGKKVCNTGKSFACQKKKEGACESLNEKECSLREDCYPAYGSNCQGELCTQDRFFGGCKNREKEDNLIMNENDARQIALMAFHRQWFQGSDGCGRYNEETGMMEPEEIGDIDKEDEGYKITLKMYCGMYNEMPEEPDIEHQYLVKWNGEVYWDGKMIYQMLSTTSGSSASGTTFGGYATSVE